MHLHLNMAASRIAYDDSPHIKSRPQPNSAVVLRFASYSLRERQGIIDGSSVPGLWGPINLTQTMYHEE